MLLLPSKESVERVALSVRDLLLCDKEVSKKSRRIRNAQLRLLPHMPEIAQLGSDEYQIAQPKSRDQSIHPANQTNSTPRDYPFTHMPTVKSV
jgi:hypothetical protein